MGGKGSGRWPKKNRAPIHPGFMAGKLFDVWYLPRGRAAQREKVCVTMDPASVRVWAFEVLQQRVKDRYSGRILRDEGMLSRIEITDRPDGNVVWSIRFDGQQVGST